MRISRTATLPAHRTNARARYRVDFFAEVRASGASVRPGMSTWWLVDRVYIDDAQAPEVLAWAEAEAGAESRFAVYVEQRVVRDDAELVVVGLIAGEDPTPPPR